MLAFIEPHHFYFLGALITLFALVWVLRYIYELANTPENRDDDTDLE